MSLNQDKLADLGKISWLWMNSRLHAPWSTQAMMRNVIPPISHGQCRILVENEFPVAYASWAYLSEEAERRYILQPSQIRLEDWTSGNRLWFIDYVSPFSLRHSFHLNRLLRQDFSDRYARAFRVQSGKENGRIMTYRGVNAPENWRALADCEVMAHFSRPPLRA